MKESQKLLFTFFIIVLIFVFTVPIALTEQPAPKKPPDNPKPELVILPAGKTFNAGETQQFSLQVNNGDNPSNVKWGVSGGIGKITSEGFFTAGDKTGSGSVTVSAKVNGTQLSASTNVQVTAKEKLKLELMIVAVDGRILDEIILKIEEQIQLRLEVKNGYGIPPTDVEWKVTGSLGTVDPGGMLIAGDKPGRGAVIVTATVNGEKLSANIKLNVAEGETPPGPTKKIKVIIDPGSAELLLNGTQLFRVVKPQLEAGDIVQWLVVPSRIGSIVNIDNNGSFTAGQNTGKGLVVATVQSGDSIGTGKASIRVSSDITKSSPKLELKVKPEYVRVDVNGSTTFEADVKGPDKNTTYSVQWKVEPNNLGSILQSVTGDKVTFSAGTTLGKYLITATLKVGNEILTDWAVAEVVGDEKPNPAKFKVVISPESASLQVGDSQNFTASIVGSLVDLPVSWSWSVAPKKLGSVDPPSGNKTVSFTALEPGWGMLIAKVDSNGRSMNVGQAKIFVSGKDGQNQKITIIPQSAETEPRGNVEFRVVDMNGNPFTGVITWKAVPDKLGTIIGTGSTITFKAGDQAGHVLIMAKVGDGRGLGNAQARLTIRNAYGKLKAIIAGSQSPRINEPSNYEVSVTDSNGKTLDLTGASIEWRVVPNHLGTFSGTGESIQFTPTVAGRGVIMVEVNTSQGKITGRLSITVGKK
jgi:hypothetical protein